MLRHRTQGWLPGRVLSGVSVMTDTYSIGIWGEYPGQLWFNGPCTAKLKNENLIIQPEAGYSGTCIPWKWISAFSVDGSIGDLSSDKIYRQIYLSFSGIEQRDRAIDLLQLGFRCSVYDYKTREEARRHYECPECFGTGFKGGFQAACSRGCLA